MKRSTSIRFELTGWYAIVLTLTLAIAGFGVWFMLRKSIHDTVDQDLRARLGLMREFIDRLGGNVEHLSNELGEDAALAPTGSQFRLCDRAGRWIYKSPEAQKWPVPSPRVPSGSRIVTNLIDGKPVRILTAPVSVGVIEIGLPLEEFYEMLHSFTWAMLVATPILLILASGGGYWMSRRALRPVEDIAAMASKISWQNLSGRLPLRGSGDELDRLSDVLNEMLHRLDSAFRRITQFTADASHELRTPLAIVQTTAEITLSKPRTPDEHIHAWKLVLAESDRTAHLIDDLLTLARADSGADGIVLETMDLADCIRSSCQDAAVLFETAGIMLRIELPETLEFFGDSEALRRLCLILLDNAIKYSERGGIVRVRLTSEESGGRFVILEVKDNGVGISEADQQNIFNRFYRVSKDRTRKTGGVGLGLSIAEWIANRHQGSIVVESTLGIGSAFRVRFPLSRS